MKYSVEINERGYVETLEVNGLEYHKRWTRTCTDASCEDYEFYEQLGADGIDDEEILELVCAEIADDCFASSIDRIYMNAGLV